MDISEVVGKLLTASKPTLLALLGMFFVMIAILGRFKDFELRTRNERIVAGIVGAFLIIIGLAGEGPIVNPATPSGQSTVSPSATPSGQVTVSPDKIRIKISGSTTMAQYNQRYKQEFESKYPGANVEYTTQGSDLGVLDLYSGVANIAAISRELKDVEKKDFAAKRLGSDDIAVVVGKANPWKGGLTVQELAYIFQGKYQNWSEIEGVSKEQIIVWNRPTISGTHKTFKDIVLKGQKFGETNNVKQLDKDGVTYWLSYLKNNGIGYASCLQVCKETKVRTVPIDGYTPGQGKYPLVRNFYYAYKKNPLNPEVEFFINYVTREEK